MSVAATIQFQCTATETLEGNADSASSGNRVVTHALFNVTSQLDGTTSTPKIKEHSGFVKALAAGAGEIDLTALIAAKATPTRSASFIDGTGLVVRYVRVTNLGDNPLLIETGDTNGHDFFAEVTVGPRATVAFLEPEDRAEEIGAAAKKWKLTGTGTQQSQWTILLGDPEAP